MEPMKQMALTPISFTPFSLFRGIISKNSSHPIMLQLNLELFRRSDKCVNSVSSAFFNWIAAYSKLSKLFLSGSRTMPCTNSYPLKRQMGMFYFDLQFNFYKFDALMSSLILLIIGSLNASFGSTWMCLCFWEQPDSGPELKKNRPLRASITRRVCLKSSKLILVVCSSNYCVTMRRWNLQKQNLLQRSLCLGGSSAIIIPFSKGGRKGFRVDESVVFVLFQSWEIKFMHMDRFSSEIILVFYWVNGHSDCSAIANDFFIWRLSSVILISSGCLVLCLQSAKAPPKKTANPRASQAFHLSLPSFCRAAKS